MQKRFNDEISQRILNCGVMFLGINKNIYSQVQNAYKKRYTIHSIIIENFYYENLF